MEFLAEKFRCEIKEIATFNKQKIGKFAGWPIVGEWISERTRVRRNGRSINA